MAGTIEELNFKVILDDSQFKTTITNAENLVKGLATKLQELSKLKLPSPHQIISDKGVSNAEQMAKAIEEIKTALEGMPRTVKVVADNQEEHTEEVKKTNAELGKTENLLNRLAQLTGIAFGAAGLRRFASELIQISGQFETQKMALTSMLQDANKADQIFNTLRAEALKSPYTFQDLTKYAKQLTAFNIDADQLVETEKRLADVAAGLDVDMGRIILAYGQVKAAGVLKGTELRQFTEAGVPLLQSLADQIAETEGKAISLSEVFSRISKKQIPFEMVEESFRRMTSEGGKFYNMQEVLVGTLKGKIGKLRDVWQQALYDIGESNSGLLKGAVDKITDLVANMRKFGGLIESLLIGFGSYVTVLGVAAAAQQLVFGVQTILSIGKIIKEIRAATDAVAKFNMVTKLMSPVAFALAAVATAAYAVYREINKVSEAQKRLNEASIAYDRAIDNEVDKLGSLRAVLKDAEKGTDEWNKAKDEVVKSYGKYFDGLDNEITKVGNLETAYDKLIEKVTRSISVRQFADFYTNEKQNYQTEEDAFLRLAQDKLKESAGAYNGTLIFRELRNFVVGAQGEAGEEFNKWMATLDDDAYDAVNYVAATLKGGLKKVDKAYNDFWDNVQKAKERMGFGETLMDPETLIMGLAGDNTGGNTTWKPTTSGKSPAQKKIESDIDAIKELQRAYKSLIKDQDEVDEESVNDLISIYFSWMDASLRDRRDFWTMLNEQADALEQYDREGAKKLRADVARGQAQEQGDAAKAAKKETEKAAKAMEKYLEVLRKWTGEDFNYSGKGALGAIEKLMADYSTALDKVQQKYEGAVKKAREAFKNDAKGLEKEIEKLGKLRDVEKNAVKTDYEQKFNSKIAKTFFDEYTAGLDFENLSSKSRAELDNLITDIGAAKSEALNAIDDVADKLEEKGFDVGEIRIAIGKKFDEASNKGEAAKTTKTYAQWKRAANAAAKAATELAEALEKIAEASGNSKLANFAQAVQGNANAMKSAIDGVKDYGGWWGAIIGALEYVGKELLEDYAIWAEVEASVRRSNVDVKLAEMDRILNGSSGTLGSSWMMGLRDSVNVMREARKELDGITDTLQKQEVEKTFNSSWLNPIPIETWLDNLHYKIFGFNANLFSRVNDDWVAYQEALAAGFKGIEAYIVKIQDRSGFLNAIGFSDKYVNLKTLVEELGYELYDEYGNLNAKGLQAVLDTYTKLGAEDRAWMEEAIKYSEKYQEAMEKIKETVSDLFGDISSTLADNMIESFKKTGNAVDDLATAFENLGETFVKTMLESAIYETVLKKYEKDMQDLMAEYGSGGMSYEDMLGRVNNIFDGMKHDLEGTADVYNAILDRANELNWMGQSTDDTNSLGSGIKSITEETASLLASYINAMRADLSVMRGLQENGWKTVGLIGESFPKLSDYMAEVSANTFSILTEIQSVIGSVDSEGMVVRVRSVS